MHVDADDRAVALRVEQARGALRHREVRVHAGRADAQHQRLAVLLSSVAARPAPAPLRPLKGLAPARLECRERRRHQNRQAERRAAINAGRAVLIYLTCEPPAAVSA